MNDKEIVAELRRIGSDVLNKLWKAHHDYHFKTIDAQEFIKIFKQAVAKFNEANTIIERERH